MQVRGGERLLTDGPFADTKEHLIGFYVIDVPDLDTALAWAAKVPNVRTGSVEVRPVIAPDAEVARADATASAAARLTSAVTPLEHAFREERAQVVATLARRLGDLQLAEDAVSEAFAAAAATWPSAGVPDRPGRLADDDGVAEGARRRPPGPVARRGDAVDAAVAAGTGARPARRRTTCSSSSSPAAIPRWRSRPAWR